MRQRTLDRHVLVILLFGLSNVVQARSWSEIQPLQDSEPRDSAGIAYLAGTDALIAHSSPPTTSPSSSIQTASPTITSTVSPGFTRSATYTPTTKMPSYTSSYITSAANLQTTYSSPPTTSAPTTRLPSSPAPTPPVDPYPPIQTPLFPEAWYFNYDTRSQSLYGPGYPSLQIVNNQPLMGYNNNAWAGVSNPPHYYWNEFTDTNGYGPWKGVLQNYDVSRNMCGRVGLQSPIDIQASGATCIEHHQIRSRPGDFRLKSASTMKQILPNKLRLLYQRRNCADLSNPVCAQPNPPKADFPSGFSGFADCLHVDFKVPSEHTMNGQRFDGEMQIYHLNPVARKVVAQTALIRATPDGYNYYFEEALHAFEAQYEADKRQCHGQRRGLETSSAAEIKVQGVAVNGTTTASTSRSDGQRRRSLQTADQSSGVWDPHHPMLFPSLYFWRYDGSLTEPPCGEFVTWFVADKPMIISTDQLARMKHVLLTHIDKDCMPTSVHFEESVARPIQSTAGRPVWHCTSEDFVADTGIIVT